MKVEVIKNEDQEMTYPCLMEGTESGVIVLFSACYVGVVVKNTQDKEYGFHSSNWNMTLFKPFKDKLVLSNE